MNELLDDINNVVKRYCYSRFGESVKAEIQSMVTKRAYYQVCVKITYPTGRFYGFYVKVDKKTKRVIPSK